MDVTLGGRVPVEIMTDKEFIDELERELWQDVALNKIMRDRVKDSKHQQRAYFLHYGIIKGLNHAIRLIEQHKGKDPCSMI